MEDLQVQRLSILKEMKKIANKMSKRKQQHEMKIHLLNTKFHKENDDDYAQYEVYKSQWMELQKQLETNVDEPSTAS